MYSFRLLVCLCLAANAVSLLGVQGYPNYAAHDLPNPQTNNTKCKTPFPSFLCDPDEVLSPKERQQLHLRLLNFEKNTENPDISDVCKSKGIRLSILITHNEMNDLPTLIPRQKVGQQLYNNWALDRQCGKTAAIVFSKRNQITSIGHGTYNLPISLYEMEHVIYMETKMLEEGKILLAFLDIINALENIAHNRAILLGLRSTGRPKEQCILGLRNLAIMVLITLLSAIVVFGVLGLAYHRYWMSVLKKRDEKNLMTSSWKNPPNGTQPVQSHFMTENRATSACIKTPIPVVPY